MPKLLEASGLRGKKFTKAVDNFSYNLALLHGQTDLLHKAKADASISIRQVPNSPSGSRTASHLCRSFRSSRPPKPRICSSRRVHRRAALLLAFLCIYFFYLCLDAHVYFFSYSTQSSNKGDCVNDLHARASSAQRWRRPRRDFLSKLMFNLTAMMDYPAANCLLMDRSVISCYKLTLPTTFDCGDLERRARLQKPYGPFDSRARSISLGKVVLFRGVRRSSEAIARGIRRVCSPVK